MPRLTKRRRQRKTRRKSRKSRKSRKQRGGLRSNLTHVEPGLEIKRVGDEADEIDTLFRLTAPPK